MSSSISLKKKKSLSAKGSSNSANSYKVNGNKLYYSKLFEEAIKCYDKAIELNSGEACYLTNRALCNIQLHRWSRVEADCRRALEVDPYQVKAYVFLGHAFLELKMFDEAIASLNKADQLVTNQKRYSNEEVQGLLMLARKGRQAGIEDGQVESMMALRGLLRGLLRQKKEGLLKQIESDENGDGEKDKILNKYERLESELEELFDKAIGQRKNRDVLDALCGKISFELMRDPVITPAGITYDRSDIEQHLLRVGHFDPISRSCLTLDNLIPNIALKECIHKYLEKNAWAEFC